MAPASAQGSALLCNDDQEILLLIHIWDGRFADLRSEETHAAKSGGGEPKARVL